MPPILETKRGNPAVLAALVVVSLLLITLYFREGDTGPLHGIRAVTLTVSEPFAVAGQAATSPLRAVGGYFTGIVGSKSQAETLRKQNSELKARLAEFEEMRQENARLKALAQFMVASKLKGIGAQVIDRPTNSWEGTVLIDRGTRDGVKVNMPVIAAQGLVGQVIMAGPVSSKVRLITDRNSAVAGLVQRTRSVGMIRGSLSGQLSMDFVDKASLPKKGDVVLTSGLGGAYPKGLVVGDITYVEAARSELYPSITVTSRVPITQIEEVMVLTSAPPIPALEAGE